MIDYWCNAFTPDREGLWNRVIERDELTIKLGARGDDAFVDANEMVERMNRSAIATLVMPVCEVDADADLDEFAPYALRPAEMHQLCGTHPGRFVGLFSVAPHRTGDVEDAAEAVQSSWCVGLHNHTHSWGHTFDAPVFDPYYELAANHDVPFVLQAGRSGGHRVHELGHPLAIAAPATRFPAVDFVLSHLGLPWLRETIEMALTYPNVYIGTATHPPSRWPAELLDFIRGPGSHRVMFGTGYPLIGHVHGQSQLEALDLGPEANEALRRGTARRVFTRIAAQGGSRP